jgi:DNA (cytosine-5)-methyltransferase 1
MGTGGHNVPLILVEDGIRKLTPRECFNLQGFPDSYKLPNDVANTQLYKQAGNSVTVSLIEKLGKGIRETLEHF